MAKNPYYCPETYFLSGQYDNRVLSEFYTKSAGQSYSRVIRTQDRLSVSGEWFGTLSDFHQDKALNRKYKLPVDSIHTVINDNILDIANLRAFSRKYGKIFETPVKLEDMLVKDDVFKYRIELQIDSKVTFNAYLLTTKARTTLLIFSPSELGMKSIDENAKWFMYRVRYSNTLYVKESVDNLIYKTESGTFIRVPITAENDPYICKMGRPTSISNSWDILAGKNALLTESICHLTDITSTYVEFLVYEKYLNNLKEISTLALNFYIINRPNRTKCTHFTNNDNNASIVNVGFLTNPFGNKNLVVYEFNPDSMVKLNRISTKDIELYAFPDIYDFSTLQENVEHDLLIESYEYQEGYDIFNFDNHGKDIIDNMGEQYSKSIGSGTSSSVLNYTPNLPQMDIQNLLTDFLQSEYKDDLRGYMLDKLSQFLATDSYEYVKLTKFIDNLNRRVITRSGALSDFNTTTQEDYTVFRHKSETKSSPSAVFLNGTYKIPEKSVTDKDNSEMVYTYINTQELTSELSRYDDTSIKIADPITIDMYTKTSDTENPKYSDDLIFGSVGEYATIFDGQDVTGITIGDLLFYNANTGEIYPHSKFKFGIDIETVVAKTLNDDIVSITDEAGTVEYLVTSLEKYYATMGGELIILSKFDDRITTDDLDKLSEIYPNGIDDLCNKEINFKNFQVTIKDPELVYVDIKVITTNFYRVQTFTGDEVVDNTLTVPKMYGNLTPKHYEVYVNGTLLDSTQHTMNFPSNIGGDLDITFNITVNPDDTINVIHTPTMENTIEVNINDRLMKPNFLSDTFVGSNTEMEWSGNSITIDLTDIEDIINFENARVFLNGARVALDKQMDYKVANILHFTEEEIESKIRNLNFFGKKVDELDVENMKLTIKYPSRDKDIYNMNPNTLENNILREFCLIDKTLPPN